MSARAIIPSLDSSHLGVWEGGQHRPVRGSASRGVGSREGVQAHRLLGPVVGPPALFKWTVAPDPPCCSSFNPLKPGGLFPLVSNRFTTLSFIFHFKASCDSLREIVNY